MKDYSLDKEQAKHYIKDFRTVKAEGGDEYEIIFADGTVFKQVQANEENLKKIERIQEEQAKSGVANKDVFISRRTKTGILTGLSAVVAGTVGYGLTTLVANAGFVDPTALTLAIGTGVITILGSIPAFAKLVKNCGKVKELEKIEYRDAHQQELSNIDNYANSLSGVSSKVTRLIEEEENPFSILNIDSFTQEDLETIIDNMEREEKTGLQYTKHSISK